MGKVLKMNSFDYLFEKTAMARSYKKKLHTLSPRNLLRLDKVYDGIKELKGLEKGTADMIKKYNIQVFEGDPRRFANLATKATYTSPFKKRINKMQGVSPAKFRNNIEEMIKRDSGWFSALGPGGDIRVNYRGDIDKFVDAVDRAMPGAKMKLTPWDKRYLKAIFDRHEVNEITTGLKSLSNPKYHARVKGEKVVATNLATHLSPEVVAREAVNLAFAPQAVKDFMTRMRWMSSDLMGSDVLGFEYGKGAFINKKPLRKATDYIAKINKDRISRVADKI